MRGVGVAVGARVAPGWTISAQAALARVAWTGTFVFVLFQPLSLSGTQITLGVAAGALLLLRLAGVRVGVASPIILPSILLPVASIAAALLAWAAGRPPLDPVDLLFWRSFLAPIVVLLALEAGPPGEDREAPRRRAVLLVVVWGAALLVPALVAWVQVRTGFDLLHALGVRAVPKRVALWWSPGRFAAIGFYTWYTRFGLVMLVAAAATGGLALLAPLARRTRLFLGVTSAATAAAAVLSSSRSVWLGLGAAAVTLALLAGGRAARLGVPLALAAVVLVALAAPGLRLRLAADRPEGLAGDRETVWRVCAAVVADHPLTGIGFGALSTRAKGYYERLAPAYPIRDRCHDVFYTALAEGGPLLLAATLAWWGLVGAGLLRLRRGADALGRAAVAGALAALAALLVNALVHDLFWSSEPVYALGVVLAVAAVLARPRAEVAA